SALIGKLVGVQLDGYAMLFRGIEYARRLDRRKADALAERIDRVCELGGGSRGQHLVANQRDVFVGTTGELRRQGMRAEKRRPDVDAVRCRQAPGGAQHLELVRRIESVAGFDLDRGDALGDKTLQPNRALRDQLVFSGGTGGAHGRSDTAAGLRDLLVRCAREPHFELVGAIARVNQVRVAVDEPGSQPRTAAIVLGRGAPAGRQVASRTDPGDAAVANRQRAIANRPVSIGASRGLTDRREMDVDPHRVPAGGGAHVNSPFKVIAYRAALSAARVCTPLRTCHWPPAMTSPTGAFIGPKIAPSSNASPRCCPNAESA